MFETIWQGSLSINSQDVAADVAEFAYLQTVEGSWKQLDTLLARDEVTEATYKEIKIIFTFELNKD